MQLFYCPFFRVWKMIKFYKNFFIFWINNAILKKYNDKRRKNMKFKLFFILIFLLCLVFCGCKQEPLEATTVPTTVVTEPPTEPPAPKAGLLLKNLNADDQDGIALQTTLEHMGYEVLLRDAENDQSKQNEQALSLVDAGCEILVLQPVMISGLDVLLGNITEVPVIVLDAQPVLGEGFENVATLTPRKTTAGAVEASILETLPNGGDINGDGLVSLVLVEGPDKHLDSTSRATGFKAALDPETHIILETVSADWNEDGGRSGCAQLLAKYGPDAEVIVTFGEEMGFGAIDAVENGGWIPGQDFHLLSVGSSTAIRNETRLGRLSGLSAPDSEARLNMLMDLVSMLTQKQDTEKIYYIDYIPIMP